MVCRYTCACIYIAIKLTARIAHVCTEALHPVRFTTAATGKKPTDYHPPRYHTLHIHYTT